jgi:hypothetical protein
LKIEKVPFSIFNGVKTPMRFGIWTFLDILKMSIFGFLEEMFFCRTEKSGVINIFIVRTEKSGVINIFIVRTENGKENITITFVFFKNFGKMTLEK